MPGKPDIAPDERPVDASPATIRIQICYLTPQTQTVLDVDVPYGVSVAQALRLSGILQRHPEIDITTQKLGVFGKLRGLEERVHAGDRLEIYRPLSVDPKVARARRVAKARKGGSREGRKWANREYR
jgi:putative ubiquitin-RnfH superfamily antitoxin RatB of RatAB toxin-antitoxin module